LIAAIILAIPLTVIVKFIFDRIIPLVPVGFLLGNDVPELKN